MHHLTKNTQRLLLLLIGLLPFGVLGSTYIKPVSAADPKVNMPYANGRVVYNLKTGMYNVYSHDKLIFSNIVATCKVNGKILSSADFPERKYNQISISDKFGSGSKHTVTLKGNGGVEMKQVFYIYNNRPYFITQLELTGGYLKSNYMSPFKGSFAGINGDVRTVFFPFDNDTFISYNSKPFIAPAANTSSETGVVFDNTSRKGFVFGSIEHEVWKTGVSTSTTKDSGNMVNVFGGYSDLSVTRDNIPHGEIGGATIKSPKVFVGYFDDWRAGLEEYGKANRMAEPPFIFNWTNPTPVGWNSWGVLQDKITYDEVIKVAGFIADSLPGFRTGNTAYVDLDAFWDNMLKGGSEGDYSKLKEFADYCKSRGLQPGVYWAPFTDWGWKSGPNRKVEGSQYTWGDIWTKVGNGYHEIDGARAIDPTHPGTQQRIAYIIGKLKACGFKMIKIDFLGHGTAESTHFYDTTVTTGMQAYRKGMEYLIKQLDGQMLVYAAISPNLATARYVHTRRIACDGFKSMHDTQYTLNSVNYGWWLTYMYNFIDADQLVLGTETPGVNRARVLSGIITGTFFTGDDFSTTGQWTGVAKKLYQNKALLKVIKNGKAFRPVEGNTGDKTTEMFTQWIGNDFYLAVFNYSNDAKEYKISRQRLGLSLNQKYTIENLLPGDAPVSLTQLPSISKLPANDAALYKFSKE